ncbi:sporulation protein [Streptomyces sp. NPDC053750]|uniref:sporulation protein n=1 Tax=Streptomyces sp. NPDC053750 TaxID=3365714 RepID=UPI0037D65B71
MAFRKFLSSLGVNAPSVETVLGSTSVRPGDKLSAKVTVQGGGADVQIERFALDVVTRFEDNESSETGWSNPGVLLTWKPGSGAFTLHAGETLTWDVEFDLPWEMPLTHALGSPVKGGRAAVRTELAVDNAVDKGDFDEFEVHALPAQDSILRAYLDLGYRLDEAEVKHGVVKGGDNSKANHWQEFELWFPVESGRSGQLETAFIAREDSLDLVIGSTGPHAFSYAQAGDQAGVTAWLKALLDAHGL